jgi:hypothetical protein
MPSPSQADLDAVKALALDLALRAQEAFKESPLSPLLALAALTTAACEVAVVTDTSFAQFMELIGIHYQAAAVGIAVQELETQLGHRFSPVKPPGDEEPS